MPWWRARLTRVDELWPPVVGAAAANKGESPLSVGIAIGFVAWQPPPPPSLFPILYLLRGERRRESQCPSHIVTQRSCQGRKRREKAGRMPHSRFSGSLRSPKIDVVIDMGNPFLNRTVDGFLKIGAVGACKVAAEETFECLHRGDVSKHKLEHALKKMCKEGAYWGTVAGVYVGMVYGVERVRGRSDWKNAMIGGALSGALISGASNNHKDKIIKDAITAGAVATAVEFINYLT